MDAADTVKTYSPKLSIMSLCAGLVAPAVAFFLFMAGSVGQQPTIAKFGLSFLIIFGIVNTIACIIQMKIRVKLLDVITAGVWVVGLGFVVYAEYTMALSIYSHRNPRIDYLVRRFADWLPLYFMVGTIVIAGWWLIKNATTKLGK